MRIVLVAGEPAYRLGVQAGLRTGGNLELVADAQDARSGFAAVDREKPDVVLVDVILRGMGGIEATREIKRRAPDARVLLLAPWPRERDVLDGFAAGADGYALKTDSMESLREAIHTVGAGNKYLSSELRGVSVDGAERGRGEVADVLQVLSRREREVLGLVVKGSRSRDIARELCISIKTVETHRNHINRKLGCASAADLTRFAAENGLLRSCSSNETGERLIVVVMDNDPQWRADLMRTAETQGYRSGRAATATEAIRELRTAGTPSVLVIEDGRAAAGTEALRRVRAVASVSAGDACRWFGPALDRTETEAATPAPRLSLSSVS
jgi:DNA-binding NarL/FixJ family response regulator